MAIHINLSGCDQKDSEWFVIEYWYDRHTQSWVIQVLDDMNREIDCSYVGNKLDRDAEISILREKYNANIVKKV